MSEEEATLMKGGETVFHADFQRSKHGITVDVKVHPTVEDFFQTQSKGQQEDPRAFARHWAQPNPQPRLYCWGFETTPQLQRLLERKGYTLNALGDALSVPNRMDGGELVNISFLRLVGASEGIGKRFHIKEAVTADALTNIASNVQQAVKDFYIDFLRPKHVEVSVVTQETR